MRIEKGKKYLCIKDVVMQGTKGTGYFKGKVYESKLDGCVTDEMGDDFHHWPEDDCTPLTETVFVEYVEYSWGENVLVMGEGGKFEPGYYYIGKTPKADSHIVLPWYGQPKEVMIIKKDLNDYT